MTEQEYKTAWAHEPDAQDLTNIANEVKRAYAMGKTFTTVSPIDVDEQWSKFCANHIETKRSVNYWHRWVVAASMLFLCTLGVALGWNYLHKPPIPSSTIEVTASPTANDSILEDARHLTFRNATLQTILQEVTMRHGAQLKYRCSEEIRLYVELEKAWTLQQCVDFLNHFERVNLRLTSDNTIIAE